MINELTLAIVINCFRFTTSQLMTQVNFDYCATDLS